MTNEEIVRDYRLAKAPFKQIGILADRNECSREEIVEILREAGCTLPKRFLGGKQDDDTEKYEHRIRELEKELAEKTDDYESRIERLKERGGNTKAKMIIERDRANALENKVKELEDRLAGQGEHVKSDKDYMAFGDAIFENMQLKDMIILLVERYVLKNELR